MTPRDVPSADLPDARRSGLGVLSALRGHLPLLAILGLALGLRLLYIGAPLLDAHRWRQVDTAEMARLFYEGSINPLRPEVNWGGAEGYVESEFPLLPAIVAVIYRSAGPDETWGRLVVVLFSVATVWLTYLLTRDLLDVPAARAAALLVAISPAAVFYGRTFMPDTLMLAFSLAAVLGFVRYFADGRVGALMYGSVALALAILVKLPGVLVVAPLLGAAWTARRWAALRDRRALLALAAPTVVAIAWYWHAYATYLQTGLTFGIIGTTKTYPAAVANVEWTTAFSKWSSLELLTSGDFYNTIVGRLYFLHLTPAGLALAAIGWLLWRRVPWRRVPDFWLLAQVVFILGAGNGHLGHDYYQLPLVPIGAMYFGAAVRPIFDGNWIRARFGAGRGVRWGLAAAVLGIALLSFHHSGVIQRHFRPESLDVRIRQAGEAIGRAAPDDALLVVVDDYGVNSPMLLYFAHAKGWSFSSETATAHVVTQLAARGARYFATTTWARVRDQQPDLALYLATRREVPLDEAPAGTAMFDLTAPR